MIIRKPIMKLIPDFENWGFFGFVVVVHFFFACEDFFLNKAAHYTLSKPILCARQNMTTMLIILRLS